MCGGGKGVFYIGSEPVGKKKEFYNMKQNQRKIVQLRAIVVGEIESEREGRMNNTPK